MLLTLCLAPSLASDAAAVCPGAATTVSSTLPTRRRVATAHAVVAHAAPVSLGAAEEQAAAISSALVRLWLVSTSHAATVL